MGLAEGAAALLHVELAYGVSSREVLLEALTVPAGATLAEALAASALVARHALRPGNDAGASALTVGIWGHQRPLDTRVREGDRIEIYRPLRLDPMQARRLRHQRQAGKPAGRKRAGGPA